MYLPILEIDRSKSPAALGRHVLTPDEQKVFSLFDSKTAGMPENTPLTEYYDVVAELGKQLGLDREQSIAFWIRTTFSMFES